MISLGIENTLHHRVSSALAGSPYLARLSQQGLRFEEREGRVVLRGVVNSFFQKQMAQETLRRLDGVAEIENLLEVDWT